MPPRGGVPRAQGRNRQIAWQVAVACAPPRLKREAAEPAMRACVGDVLLDTSPAPHSARPRGCRRTIGLGVVAFMQLGGWKQEEAAAPQHAEQCRGSDAAALAARRRGPPPGNRAKKAE